MSNPAYSIIIPCYNSASSLKNLLLSIKFQESAPTFEVILVDNNSSDSPHKCLVDFPEVQVISCSLQGAAPARNEGARYAKGKYLVFIDADVIIPKFWLNNLNDIYEHSPWVDLVAGTVTPGLMNNRLLHQFRVKLLNHKTSGTGNFLSLDPALTIPLVNTALCSIKADRFNLLKGFETQLMRHEDWELTDRVLHSSMHMRSLELPGEVYFERDHFLAYFRRSFDLGFWFPSYEVLVGRKKMLNPLLMLFPQKGVQDPLYELLRIVNSFFISIGYFLGFLKARKLKAPVFNQGPNMKNFLLFNFIFNTETYGLNPYIAIVQHPRGINLFYGTSFIQFNKNESETFLKCFKGRGFFTSSEESLLARWVEKNIFIPLDYVDRIISSRNFPPCPSS